MRIDLPAILKSAGGKISISIDYEYTIPENGSDRTGWLKSANGVLYDIAQWFPRMCVYDDVLGWNTQAYLGQGEFYLDYGWRAGKLFSDPLIIGKVNVG